MSGKLQDYGADRAFAAADEGLSDGDADDGLGKLVGVAGAFWSFHRFAAFQTE
jgi:hypothetical protein